MDMHTLLEDLLQKGSSVRIWMKGSGQTFNGKLYSLIEEILTLGTVGDNVVHVLVHQIAAIQPY